MSVDTVELPEVEVETEPVEASDAMDVEVETQDEVVAVADTDPNDSWWQEPEDEASTDDQDEEVEPAVVAEGLSEMPSVSDHDDSGDGSDVEEDTEAFLEKVFSELESTPESKAEEGHGLLRRRRMGTLRDFSSDS